MCRSEKTRHEQPINPIIRCFFVGVFVLTEWCVGPGAYCEEIEPGTPSIALTAEEQAWIAGHPVIRLGIDPEFFPFDYIDDQGKYCGIASDYVHLLNTRLGLNMQIVPRLSWQDVIEKARRREVDVLPCVGMTSQRQAYLTYSDSYINFYRVIITRLDKPFLSGIDDIGTWKVGIQAATSHEGFIREETDIDPVLYATLQDALLGVSKGEVEAVVGNVASATYWIRRMNLTNLKVAAAVSERENLYFAVRQDWPELVGLINKGLASITPRERVEIRQRWIDIEYNPGIAPDVVFKYIVEITGGAVLLGILFVVWNRRLKAEIHEKQQVEKELIAAKETAESANRAKSAFLASMSHELRTPLNSIIGFNGMLIKELAGPLNFEQKKQLRMIKSSARHLLDLINDILDISKIEAGELKLSYAPFNMAEMVRHVLDGLEPLASAKGLRLKAEIGPEVNTIVSDERRIRQVLLNLINNAIKFTDHGSITVSCHVRHRKLVVSIRDTGIGIRQRDIGKLFQTFNQLDTGINRRYEGTGLGLSICRRIVEMAGGHIQAVSKFGKGSTFLFVIPIGGPMKDRPDETGHPNVRDVPSVSVGAGMAPSQTTHEPPFSDREDNHGSNSDC